MALLSGIAGRDENLKCSDKSQSRAESQFRPLSSPISGQLNMSFPFVDFFCGAPFNFSAVPKKVNISLCHFIRNAKFNRPKLKCRKGTRRRSVVSCTNVEKTIRIKALFGLFRLSAVLRESTGK